MLILWFSGTRSIKTETFGPNNLLITGPVVEVPPWLNMCRNFTIESMVPSMANVQFVIVGKK